SRNCRWGRLLRRRKQHGVFEPLRRFQRFRGPVVAYSGGGGGSELRTGVFRVGGGGFPQVALRGLWFFFPLFGLLFFRCCLGLFGSGGWVVAAPDWDRKRTCWFRLRESSLRHPLSLVLTQA